MSFKNKDTIRICESLKGKESKSSKRVALGSIFEKIILNIALEHELSVVEVRNIVKSTFEFTSIILKDSIRNAQTKKFSKSDLCSVGWLGLGSFQISKWRVNNYFKKRLGDAKTR